MNCVFSLSLQVLSETFLNQIRTQSRYYHKFMWS